MASLYHIVSNDFPPQHSGGTLLYPLNQLKDIHPSVYQKHQVKYVDRAHVQQLYIPQLDCFWGDVVHLSAVPPQRILELLQQLGHPRQFSYYEIDPHVLDPSQTVVYTNRPREDMKVVSAVDFQPFDPDHVDEWNVIPPETVEYYKRKFAEGARPKLFVFIPHILSKQPLDVTHLSIKTIGA